MTRLNNMTSEVGKDKGDDDSKGNTTQNNNHQVQPQQQQQQQQHSPQRQQQHSPLRQQQQQHSPLRQQQQQHSPLRQPEQLIVRRSFRKKQLPQVPKDDGTVSPASAPGSPPAMFERGFSADQATSVANSPNGKGSYGQLFLEYALMAEFNQLQKQRLPGVYVIPSARSPLHWFGVLFIRQGTYQEGVFKFDVHIPENYPDGDCPRLVFHPPIFHPIVDIETGELDVNRAFNKWRRNVNHIWQVLLYARRIFYKIDTKAPLNPEAAVLCEEDMVLFKAKVADTIAMCKSAMYDPPYSDDPHAITFSKLSEDKHREALKAITKPKKSKEDIDGPKNAQTSGLSWVKPGTLQVFSKDDH